MDEMGEAPEKAFAMFCGQRTGSTNLWLLLKAVTGIEIVHEPFAPGRFDVKQTDVVSALKGLYQDCLAIKHMHEHLPRKENEQVLCYFNATDLPVLYLRRRDPVRRAVSRALAELTGQWMKDPEKQTEYRNSVASTPLNIGSIKRRLATDLEDEAIYSGLLSGENALHVFYEDVFTGGADAKRKSLEELFLHISYPLPADADSHIKEFTGIHWHQNPDEICRLVPNWKEVQKHFSL